MTPRSRTRLLCAAIFAMALTLFSSASGGAEPAPGEEPKPGKIAAKPVGKNVKLPGLVINFRERCVDIEGSICLDRGFLELIACTKNSKEHESIVAVTARPMHIHTALLLPFLKHEDWWLQNATLTALTPVVADERCYQRVLPPIGELVRTNQRSALTLGLMGSLRAKLKGGSRAVQQLATETLKETFSGYAGVKTAPGGQNIASTYDSHLEFIAASLADVPGGLDVLYEIAGSAFLNRFCPTRSFS